MKAVKRSAGAVADMEKRRVPIPKWVIPEFRDEYQSVGALFGEEKAASHVRRLLAEMRAAA
jgi:hypothetical protein